MPDENPDATETPPHIVLFGRPGSGKSSLAERLRGEMGFVVVRTGEWLRACVRAGDPIGQAAVETIALGQLVPDSLIEQLLDRNLPDPARQALLFDGFPRTLGQAPILERLQARRGFTIRAYVELAIDREAAVARMTGRRVCPACGATYHVVNQPPRVPGVCDRDGTPLRQRPDDTLAVIDERQDVYDRETRPVVEHYERQAPDRFLRVDGLRPFDEVVTELVASLACGG